MSHFTFNFDVDDQPDNCEETVGNDVSPEQPSVGSRIREGSEPFSEISLTQLLDNLPSLITFSPLVIPLSSGRQLTLHRRDLFDVRFQLISEDNDWEDGTNRPSALGFVDNPSDLVPGVYEGGLKTWECSLDLVDYLEGLRDDDEFRDVRGKRILELGCGTAVPSLYLLHRIFSSESAPEEPRIETTFHFQDYNASVLELVTFPNIIVTWYMSPASTHFRILHSRDSLAEDGETSPTTELSITPSLIKAFLGSLERLGIYLRFFPVSWANFDVKRCGGRYNVVLTSETIYRKESIRSLISAMQAACCGSISPEAQNKAVMTMEQGVETNLGTLTTIEPSLPPPVYLCLVAVKVVYFGVGGGVAEFIRSVETPSFAYCRKGNLDIVWERQFGIGRRIMRIKWVDSKS